MKNHKNTMTAWVWRSFFWTICYDLDLRFKGLCAHLSYFLILLSHFITALVFFKLIWDIFYFWRSFMALFDKKVSLKYLGTVIFYSVKPFTSWYSSVFICCEEAQRCSSVVPAPPSTFLPPPSVVNPVFVIPTQSGSFSSSGSDLSQRIRSCCQRGKIIGPGQVTDRDSV